MYFTVFHDKSFFLPLEIINTVFPCWGASHHRLKVLPMAQKASYDLVSGHLTTPSLSSSPHLYVVDTLAPSNMSDSFPQGFCARHFLFLKCSSSKYLSGLLLISLPVVIREATLSKIAVLASLHPLSQYPCLTLFFLST